MRPKSFAYLISREMLLKQAYANLHELPRVESLIIHKRLSKTTKPSSRLETEAVRLHLLTGQKPKFTRAKRSNAKFGIRQGDLLGCKVSLRGERADRFLHLFTFGMSALSEMYTLRTKFKRWDTTFPKGGMAFGLRAETDSAQSVSLLRSTDFEGCIQIDAAEKADRKVYLSAFLT